MDEAAALFDILQATAPDAPTACAGWTAHHLTAHLAAGAAEMAALTEEVLTARPPRESRDLADREAPFVALDDATLRDRLVSEALRLDAAVAALEATGRDAAVRFSGQRLTAADLSMHGRSEAALHRWDLAGDDEISAELLRQPDLTAHAVTVLTAMPAGATESLARRALAVRLPETRATFGSPGQPDVVVIHDARGTRLRLADPVASPTASADPATRLLALWGRRSRAGIIRWSDDAAAAEWLRSLLWGHLTAASHASSPTD